MTNITTATIERYQEEINIEREIEKNQLENLKNFKIISGNTPKQKPKMEICHGTKERLTTLTVLEMIAK